MKNSKAIATLILIAMFVPEVLTGSTPLSGYLNPVALAILFVGYGLAVLVIREFAVRNNLNFAGIFLLGFAYSILNEGLIAKTMILKEGLSMAEYNGYAYVFGISLAWSAAIGLWHAVSSVLFPILAAHTLFSDESDKPWVNKKLAIFIAVLILALSTTFFFNEYKVSGTLSQFIILASAMFALVLLSKKFGRKGLDANFVAPPSGGVVWLGISTFLFLFLLLSSIVAGLKLSPILFFALYGSGIWLYLRVLKSKQWMDQKNLLLFSVGCYIPTALTGIALAFGFSGIFLERIVTEVVATISLVWIARKIIKK